MKNYFFLFILCLSLNICYAQETVTNRNGKEITVNSPATNTAQGQVKLTGDLGGTADSPTVPTLTNKLEGTGTLNYVPKFSAAKTLTNSLIFDNGTNVGIGTTTPANKLEITQGTAGNSGLRFTNLNSSSTATTSLNKVLAVNSTGDVILTNVPGTQNIIDFSTATPTTSGVVFTPNTPADESVVYQSAVDNSMWTYNGSTYVTYSAPASTAWFTAGTTNDAGNSKTSNIYRTGNVGIGTTTPESKLHVKFESGSISPTFERISTASVASTSLKFLLNASTNPISSQTPGYFGQGFHFVYKSDTEAEKSVGAIASKVTDYANGKGELLFIVNGNTTFGPSMIIKDSGNVGIGTTTPANKLEITQGTSGNSGLRFTNLNSSSTATTSLNKVLAVNSTGDVILTNVPGTQNIIDFSTATPTTSGVVFTPNTPADESVVYQSAVDNSMWTYNGSTYVTYNAPASSAWYTAGTTNDAGNSKTSNIYRTGNVGVNITNPLNKLVVKGVNDVPSALGTVQSNATFRVDGDTNHALDFGTLSASPYGSYIQSYNKVSTSSLALSLNPSGGNVGIGTTTPSQTLDVVGNVKFSGALMPNNLAGTSGQVLTSAGAGVPPVWAADASTNIYTADGTLTANRKVTQAENKLTFEGTASTGGTTEINNSSGSILRLTAKGTTAGTTGRAALAMITPSGRLDTYIDSGSSVSMTSSVVPLIVGTASGNSSNLNLMSNGTTAVTVSGSNQNVGIGTILPVSKLEVNGASTNTTAFNAAAATSIDFTKSNLAYTSANAGAFTLTGMKDGGTYTLAVQGATSGTSSFTGSNPSATAFTFKPANNAATTASKHTLYTFLVMGTNVYYYMVTGL